MPRRDDNRYDVRNSEYRRNGRDVRSDLYTGKPMQQALWLTVPLSNASVRRL